MQVSLCAGRGALGARIESYTRATGVVILRCKEKRTSNERRSNGFLASVTGAVFGVMLPGINSYVVNEKSFAILCSLNVM